VATCDPSTPSGGGANGVPVATVEPHGQVIRIAHVNRAAGDMRIRAGQTLAEAKAVAPHLVTYDHDPAADRRELESLAVWADSLSPVVHIEGKDTLIADVTGCQRLFGGEANLLRQAVEGLRSQGFAARCAIADTPGAAWALAHAYPEPTFIAQPGQTSAALTPLPVWSLRVDATTTDALASVGVETISSLLYLPRSSLAPRFGQTLLDRIDLTEAIRRALVWFCQRLEKRTAGVRHLFVTFYCPDVVIEEEAQTRTVTLPVTLSRPTRSVDHLYSLLLVVLDRLHLPGPADSLTIWAREIDPLDGWQGELFATDAAETRELGSLLDRLAVRLGPHAVVRPRLLSEHQPERAFRYVSVVNSGRNCERRIANGVRASACSRSSSAVRDSLVLDNAPVCSPRPLRLALHPVEIAATSLVPDGPPFCFHLHGTRHGVTDSLGPERIETGWWRGPHVKRDYYRVVTEEGRRLWLFHERDTGRWFARRGVRKPHNTGRHLLMPNCRARATSLFFAGPRIRRNLQNGRPSWATPPWP
jgi:protein ImuB